MDIPITLSNAYEPQTVEDRIYKTWVSSGLFNPDAYPEATTPFSVVMPPLNAINELSIDNASVLVLQDLMVRYHRMKGHKTVWIPSVDHSSIAIQNIVETILEKEGTSGKALGREKYLERASHYIKQSNEKIREQTCTLGSSCDWTREHDAFGPEIIRAVRTMFVTMHDDGLVRRETRIVNWCPHCVTTVGNDEVEYKDQESVLYYIKYPIKNSDSFITITGTRLETIFGEVAIAVNPTDERYKQYIGSAALLPLANREIPIIADDYVDMTVGTGAHTVTPAHDHTDFDIGKKYGLNTLRVIDEEAKLNFETLKTEGYDMEAIQSFEGVDRFVAREAIATALDKAGFIEKTETRTSTVGHCQYCRTVIEPTTSLQWFVDVNKKMNARNQSLKEMAMNAVHSKTVTITPAESEKEYVKGVEEMHDWCISRHVWFGHQIPVSYCLTSNGGCGEIIVSVEQALKCPKCDNTNLTPEEDTLDTRFSESISTLTALGWPNTVEYKEGVVSRKGDLAPFYPTALFEADEDTLTSLIPRMMFMSEYALNEEPFKKIFYNKKISETSEDPFSMIRAYGTDAFRLSLLTNDPSIENARNSINKLWNIGHYILTLSPDGHKTPEQYTLADLWIISRLNRLITNASDAIEQYEYARAMELLHTFTDDEFAGWYIEISKGEKNKHALLLSLLEVLLVLWHPIIPFVTEEIYRLALSSFPAVGGSRPALLMVRAWPQANSQAINEQVERDFGVIQQIIQELRDARTEHSIPTEEDIDVIVYTPHRGGFIAPHIQSIARFIHAKNIAIQETGERPVNALFMEVEDIELYIPLNAMKLEEERVRLDKKIHETESAINQINAQLSDQEFLAKTSEGVIQNMNLTIANYQDENAHMQQQRKRLI